ncbi:MAG: glutamate 5-kinase, partial [Chloroflexi bacterium]|nr:glutamate 5-kinase [Chloroflexota bacterium]
TAIDDDIMARAGGAGGSRGTGGMLTKLQAARLATASGVAVVIADGRERNALDRLARSEALGTYFTPTVTGIESRKRWMVSGLALRGPLQVDHGAAAAVLRGRSSLLPAGIRTVEGEFQRGDVVAVLDAHRRRIACGLVNYGARDLDLIKGLRSTAIEGALGYQFGDEAIHRNNLVLL